jgi:diguanylate cyclase (GGDEF)-like protein
MGNLSEGFKERLEKLSRKYAHELPDKLALIEQKTNAALKTAGDSHEYADLRFDVHKIHGNAASFGFVSVSAVAREFEILLDSIIVSAAKATKDQEKEIAEFINELNKNSSTHNPTVEVAAPSKPVEKTDIDGNGDNDKRAIACCKSDSLLTGELLEQLSYFGLEAEIFDTIEELFEKIGEFASIILIMDIEYLKTRAGVQDKLLQLKTENIDRFSIIYISQSDDFDTRLLSVRAGGDAFFFYPVDITHLVDKIDVLTEKNQHEPFHILIVDDDPEQISQNALILQQAGMITSVASDPQNLIKIIIEAKPELILMDLYMPGCSGLELAALIRQQEAFVGIPIVFLSAEKNIEKQLQAISKGGDDFLTKPIKPHHLVTAIAIRAERTRKMRYFMETDSLTGLLNHTNLKEKLHNEVERAMRIGNKLCFVMIDLDHFKNVNDVYGHLAGDRVIKSLSKLLQERLRKTDIIGRYGGEEFGVILFNTDIENAAVIMGRINESFGRIRHREGDKYFYVTFSCGIASYPEFKDSVALNEAADSALYKAKELGRDRVVLAEE